MPRRGAFYWLASTQSALAPLRETMSRGASWRPASPTLHMLAISSEGPSSPPETITRRTYLVDADAMGMSVDGDGLPIATSTSPTTSESERHECNWDSTAHLTDRTDATYAHETHSLNFGCNRSEVRRTGFRAVCLCRAMHARKGACLGGSWLTQFSTQLDATIRNRTPHDATDATLTNALLKGD
jgi:hypothetical protein